MSPRFTDNNNGTVKDNLTGLIWLKYATGLRLFLWADALTECATLKSGNKGLTDGSGEGDWRLPNAKELYSLVDLGRSSPALPIGHPFIDVWEGDQYWSSSTCAADTNYAWCVVMNEGEVTYAKKMSTNSVWPVRGGQ